MTIFFSFGPKFLGWFRRKGNVFLNPWFSFFTMLPLQKKDTSVTFLAERKKFGHTYDTSMTIIVTKPGIIIDVVGSYFYDKKS